MVTFKFVDDPLQMVALPESAEAEAGVFTVTAAEPLNPPEVQLFASVTLTKVYVLFAAGDTEILLPDVYPFTVVFDPPSL